MSKAQIETYLDKVESGMIMSAKAKVLRNLLHRGSLTLAQLVHLTGIKESTVVARVSELMDDGFVFVVETTKSKGNTVSIFRFVEHEQQREHYREKRRKEKFDAWLKKGKRMFPEYLKENTVAA